MSSIWEMESALKSIIVGLVDAGAAAAAAAGKPLLLVAAGKGGGALDAFLALLAVDMEDLF